MENYMIISTIIHQISDKLTKLDFQRIYNKYFLKISFKNKSKSVYMTADHLN